MFSRVFAPLCLAAVLCQASSVVDVSKLDQYGKMCDQKEADGCHQLSISYFLGDGVSRDVNRAIEYAKKAVEHEPKNPTYLDMLARMIYHLYKSDVSGYTVSEAVGYFDSACAYKNAGSCDMLGSIYSVGEDGDVAVDFAKSLAYYKKACNLLNVDACQKLKTSKNR
jgi:TPR repeat protein